VQPWRHKLHEVIFEADTAPGRWFDTVLITCILVSVAIAMLDSVAAISRVWGRWFYLGEWLFTILFTLEYFLRLSCVARPGRYALSFFGVVDLLAVLPTYLSTLVPGGQYLIVIRILRLLRIFRVFKLVQFLGEARLLAAALKASSRKIMVFLFTVLMLAIVFGAIMYVVERAENGFTSIPRSIYWTIVTMTTVGYGDIVPQTALGQVLASFIMIIGYGIIAVPTGIVTVELAQTVQRRVSTQACPVCSAEGHDHDARHCKFCGGPL
jgi:voltage-gated potassium channel